MNRKNLYIKEKIQFMKEFNYDDYTSIYSYLKKRIPYVKKVEYGIFYSFLKHSKGLTRPPSGSLKKEPAFKSFEEKLDFLKFLFINDKVSKEALKCYFEYYAGLLKKYPKKRQETQDVLANYKGIK
jgi:hypothetical protein